MAILKRQKANGEWEVVKSVENKTGIIDSLTSTSTTEGLSANQGKVLNDKITQEVNSLKQYVSNGKNLIASAITDKKVSTGASDTFQTMATNISSIRIGKYNVGDTISLTNLQDVPSMTWKNSESAKSILSVNVDNNGNIYSGSIGELRKFDSSGNLVWSFKGHTSAIRGIDTDESGNVYSCGLDNTVRKINSNGSQVWSFTGHTDWVRCVAVDSDGNVYSGGDDYKVRKINSSGTQVWQYAINILCYCIAVDTDGNVYGAGSDNGGVRKISSSGSLIWKTTDSSDYTFAVAVDSNKNVYNGGGNTSNGDYLLRKHDSNGSLIWKSTGHTATINSLALDSIGNVYSGGRDYTIRQFNSSGVEIWKYDYGYSVNSVASDASGNVYCGGEDFSLRKISKVYKILA